MVYSFHRSPAKELKAINHAVQRNNYSVDKKGVSKRLLQDEPDTVDGAPLIKKLATGSQNAIGSKIQNIFSERGAASDPVIITLPQRAP